MASRSRWVRRTFSGIGACEDGRVMVRLLCRGCGLQTAHCKPADQHRQLASAIGWQLPPGHLLARLARAHDEPRSSARAPVAPRCRAAAASSTGMTLQGFRWGWLENRIKEGQGDLFADRTSAASMRANQLRLWFASMAYVLLCALRRIGLAHTALASATCGTIRLKLLKIGAHVRISARRVKVAMASACPAASEWRLAHARLIIAARAPPA